MAAPIMFNLRNIPHSNTAEHPNAAIVAINQFGFGSAESGFMAQVNFDADQEAKWGVTILEVRGGQFSYFSPSRMKQDKTAFEMALSFLLNEWFAGDKSRDPFITPAELPTISEQILVLASNPSDTGRVYFLKADTNQLALSSALAKVIDSFKVVPAYVIDGDNAKGSVDVLSRAAQQSSEQATLQ